MFDYKLVDNATTYRIGKKTTVIDTYMKWSLKYNERRFHLVAAPDPTPSTIDMQ